MVGKAGAHPSPAAWWSIPEFGSRSAVKKSYLAMSPCSGFGEYPHLVWLWGLVCMILWFMSPSAFVAWDFPHSLSRQEVSAWVPTHKPRIAFPMQGSEGWLKGHLFSPWKLLLRKLSRRSVHGSLAVQPDGRSQISVNLLKTNYSWIRVIRSAQPLLLLNADHNLDQGQRKGHHGFNSFLLA